ncbi:hypothetical protein HPB51_002522 [Rhipicephalus microplus]|uniref:Peptidase M13 N-terminal domain-containing protein n=1 Tax=Rhipicephalus microplus TaxID=6941 RepID=A0A9J6DEN8_RHIMP|nr:hypothetical protein HPB51_002522 [Rhipicephalus microplus]
MAEAGKGSDDKSGEPSDAPQADSEPKKSSMKATKEDGSTSGEKPKKKKKKSAEDLATHGNLGKIASEAASNRDTSTGSVKKPKGGKKSSSKEGKSDGKANATKKSSSKEGKSAGKASAVKKGRHSKVGLETLSGSEAKDAIKGKKSRKRKKKKKHVASQLPSSPVALHPPSAPDASAQSYFAYPPGTLPYPAQPPIPQHAIVQLPPASAPQTSSGVLSKIGAFLGIVERKDASQHPPADFTTASNVSTQLHPPLFLAPQGQQMPYGAFQSMPGQLAPPGGQLPMTAQQTPLVTVQPNVSLQEGYVQPNSGQPTLDQNLAGQQATVNHAMRGQNIDQPMPAEPIQGYTPSQSLPSQLTPGQPIPIQPDEQVQGKMVPSYLLPNQPMPTYLPKEPSLTEPMASQHVPGATASFIDQSVPTHAVVEQSVPLKPLFGRDYTGQTIVSRPMIVSRAVSTETASSEQTLDKASTHAQPPQISQGDMAQAINLYGPQTSIQTPIRRSSLLFTNTANPPGGPFVPALYRQGSRTEDSFYHGFAMAEPQVLQDGMPSSMLPKQLSSARTSVAQLPQIESTPRSSRFFAYGQIEMSRPAARRPSRSLYAADTLPRRSSWSSFSRRPSRTQDYPLASPGSLSGTIDDMRPNSHEDYDVMEPVESRRDSSAKQRSSCMRLSQSRLHAETRELAEDFDSTRAWRFSVGRLEPPQRTASASTPYQPWETRCAADTTQHIKYTAAVAEDLRVASLALRRLQYNNERERRRRDFLATELMKRAALASSEVRRASMALAAMYPEDAFPGDTASSTEQGGRRLSKANAKKAELPARPAAGPGGEHKAQGITSTSWREHRRMSHRGPGALPSRPANEKGRGSQSPDFLFEATSSRLADMPNARKTTSKRSLARKSSHSLDFSFQATSSGAAAMPGVRKARSKKSLARKSSRASLTTDAESSSHGDSGCDMCGGLWRGLVREAPSKESSTTQFEDVVLELGGHVTSPLTWPLACPGGRKRSSVATVTMLGAARRGSRRSKQPKQAVSDEQVTAVLLEDVQASPLECFQGVSHDIVASIAGKGDAQSVAGGRRGEARELSCEWVEGPAAAAGEGESDVNALLRHDLLGTTPTPVRKSLKVGEQVGTLDENALNRMMRDSSVGVPAEHLEREGEDQGQPAADGQEGDGPYHPMEGGRLPLDEEANVEAEMWKFAESTVPLFPESAVAVLFLLACLVWVAVVLFAGSAHHNWLNTTSDHEAKTGRPEGSPPTSPPNGPPTARPPYPTASPSSDWLVCDSALCQREARRLSTLLEGEPCRNFYDYACQRLDETPPLPKRGTASSTDTRLTDELDDALVAYVRDATHSDVAPARELLQACGTGSARDLADFVAAYVQPSWPASDATSDVAVWEAAGRLLRELNVAALVSVVPVVKSRTAVALGPAQLLLMPGDDASQEQLLSDAVRATVTFVSTTADARTVAEDVVKVLSDLSKVRAVVCKKPHYQKQC